MEKTLVDLTKKEIIEAGKEICKCFNVSMLDYSYNVVRTVNDINDPFTISDETLFSMTIVFEKNLVLEWDRENGFELYDLYNRKQLIIKESSLGGFLLLLNNCD